jgi:5-methylcytosine-specific restriction endonuclease McrA
VADETFRDATKSASAPGRAAGTRQPIGKRLRLEILKRDRFRCVNCGRTPTEAVLELDHLVPVAGGGTDDPANLFTACRDCNSGKSDRPLTSALPQVRRPTPAEPAVTGDNDIWFTPRNADATPPTRRSFTARTSPGLAR